MAPQLEGPRRVNIDQQLIRGAAIRSADQVRPSAQTRITMNLPSSLMMQPCPADRAGETPAPGGQSEAGAGATVCQTG
jgi:hypothetical protein